MDYRDILAFMGVARTGSFSAAAEHLHLAQSALSRRVLRLEQTLNVSLLERHTRGARPTSAGERLMARFGRIERELRDMEAELRAMGGGMPPELHIAMPRGAVRFFSAAMITRFHELHPGVRLHISERESAQNLESVLCGDADLALVYGAQPHDDLVLMPLLSERILVVGSPGTGDAPSSFNIEELAQLPLILPGNPHGYRRVVERLLAERGLSPTVVLEVNGFATSLNMVQQGLGYAISTHAPVEDRIAAGLLSASTIAGADWEVDLFLIHRRDAVLSPPLLALIAVLREMSAAVEPTANCRPAAMPI